MREMLSVILNGCEGSVAVGRESVRRHPSHRFFAPFHHSVSCFSYTAFLLPFRMTIGRKGVIMRGTLIVILNEREGSVSVVRKTVRCHQCHRFFTPCHHSISRLFHKAFSPPFRMTPDGKASSEANVRVCAHGKEDHKTSF